MAWETSAGLVAWMAHNRHEICTRLGLPFAVVTVTLPDHDAALDWIDANQLGRRNLSPDAFKLLLGRRYNRAKKRVGEHKGNQHTLERDQIDPIPTADKLAAQHGVSPATVKLAAPLVGF